MDLRQFYTFIAIAEESNLSRAAEKLYTSQPSLSRFLSRLERTYNTQLFERMPNNTLKITDAGEKLLALCRQTVLEFENYNHYLVEKNTYPHDIYIGVASDTGVKFMMKTIPDFSKLHPNIKVNFLQFPSNKLLEQLRNGVIDFVRMAYDQMEPDLDYTHLTEAKVDLIVPLNHPLAKRGDSTASDSNATVRLKDIQNESLVLPNQTTVLRKILQNYFETNHFEPKIDIEVATSFSALMIVESGLALALLPRAYSSDKVRFLQLDPPIYYKTGIITRKSRYQPQWAKDFIRICKEQYNKFS